jgi:hypothetical protein
MEFMLLYMISAMLEVITAQILGYRNKMLMWGIVIVNLPTALILSQLVNGVSIMLFVLLILGIVIEFIALMLLFTKRYSWKEIITISIIGNILTYTIVYFLTPLFSL